MVRRLVCVIMLCAVWLAVDLPCYAKTQSIQANCTVAGVFGPKRFVRGHGKPKTETVTFSSEQTGTGFLMKVQNGYRHHRSASGTVTLNGERIIGPSDFSHRVRYIERRVSLNATNELAVRLTSQPGSFIVITIYGGPDVGPDVSFTVSPATIEAGQTATLNWTSSGADSCSIDQGIGSVALSGSIDVSPGETTTYTITATGGGQEVSKSVTVTVTHPRPVLSFSVTPQLITAGQSATLSWESIHADSCVIEPGIGVVAPSGSLSVSPAQTTTYTITATGNGGSAQENVTLTVTYPAPTVSFSATPEIITQGQSASLTWSTTSADTVVIDQGIGGVSSNGSITVTPAATTTYTLTATGPGGTMTGSVTVTVMLGPPVVTFSASPLSITAGESATLTWSATNAEGCVIEPDIGVVGPSGATDVTPTQTTTYTITATGSGGTASATVTVRVTQPVSISITSPTGVDSITRPDILVEGVIINPSGSQIGITVNGVAATLYEDRFVANHVPLVEGQNTITATATDMEGNLKEESIVVFAEIPAEFVTVTPVVAAGPSPFETLLIVDGTVSFSATPSITDSGPGPVEITAGASPERMSASMETEGIYHLTASVQDSTGNVYTDTIAVVAMDRSWMDGVFRSQWNGMLLSLNNGDVQGALSYFTDISRDKYGRLFNLLRDRLPTVASKLSDIEMVSVQDRNAQYRLRKDENVEGQIRSISYSIYFVKDGTGLWRISEF